MCFLTAEPKVHRFLYGPRWRWTAALELYQLEGAAPTTDHWVERCVAFLRQRRSLFETDSTEAMDNPIAIALAIQRDLDMAQKLQLLVLAKADITEVAVYFEADAEWLRTWQVLFFDLGEHHPAAGWLQQYVIGPAIEAGDEAYAEQLRQAWLIGAAAASRKFMFDGLCMFADRKKAIAT